MKSKLLFLFLLFAQISLAQFPAVLRGKIVVQNGVVDNILVANLSIEKSVTSKSDGSFEIMASPDDLLVFSGMQIEYHRTLLNESDFNKLFVVQLTPRIQEIEEVEVFDIRGINAVSMGILSKPAKEYTQAERHLYTATNLNASANAGTMMGGSISLDPLINWISGRTKLLKSNLETERKIHAAKKLKSLYEESFFVDELAIKPDNVASFILVAVEFKDVITSINNDNKFVLQLKLIEVAKEFNSRISEE